ncbi:MAG TPA: sulfotransferase [Chiayiivirga sp.]|nr:sulfotransferase [Chiayiivirga sp.]
MSDPTIQARIHLATRLTESGQYDAAREAWLNIYRSRPDAGEIMLELSYVESFAGRFQAAHEWCLRACSHPPSGTHDQISLIRRLRTFNEIPRLCAFATDRLHSQSGDSAVLSECARQLSNVNDAELALRCAEAALAINPRDLGVRVLRAQLWADFGRDADSRSELEAVLAINPRIAIAWWMLARLQRADARSNHVAAIRSQLAFAGLRAIDVAALSRALHKELDDLGDHPSAWQSLEQMCRAKRSGFDHDSLHTRTLVDKLIALPKHHTHVLPNGMSPTPIFIVGMHRSGTTLLEQLLDAHPDLASLGELLDFTSAMRHATDHYCKGVIDLEIVHRSSEVDWPTTGRRYLDGVAWRVGERAFFTDKEPANFFNIGFICQALPQARIIHLVRDPVETCFSNLRELFSDVNAWSYDQHELADHFIQYRRLMTHWHNRWPGRILDVPYAELTGNTEATMRGVAAFCGLDFQPSMCDPRHSTRAVATASAIQVREGIVRRDAPKWLPYAHYLRPLIGRLHGAGIKLPAQAQAQL